MSHDTYQAKWTECMQELMEQVQIEYLPSEANENGQSFEPGFQHYALLYIKYLQIYRKLEDCHDQMVHPQKRRYIKKVLKSTIIRILELKKELIHFNPREQNRFVALDEVLTDLKLNPETVEWRVPRYFLDEKENREEIEDKQFKINHWLDIHGMSQEPDPLIDKKDPFEVGLQTDEAVAIIQKNERGRRGIVKGGDYCAWKKDEKQRRARDARQKEGADNAGEDILESQVLAATRIAAHWKRKVDRRRFLRMREEEFEFLSMAPPKSDNKDKIIEDMKKHRERRKAMREDHDDVFEKALKEQLEWLQKKKGADIKADLLEERRQWILDYYQRPGADPKGKFPKDFDEFYQRFDQEEPEDDPKAKKDDKGKKGKDDKGKKGKDGKKGKGGDDDEEPHETGPSPMVLQFVEQLNGYIEMWEERHDYINNFDQRHDIDLARKNVFPIVEAELRAIVDDQMREELANLKVLFGQAKKPPKPPKKSIKKDGKRKDGGKFRVAAATAVKNTEECVPDLVLDGILKKVTPCKLEDFWGEYHYLGAMQRGHGSAWCPAPSAQMIRSLLIEHCVLPLAQADIRQKMPESLTARSVLLYGPKGSGKSMLARAIASECGATFFDLSPSVIEGKSDKGAKNASFLLIAKTYLCAMEMAPSVIYIDQVEQVFMGGKKKRGGDAANAPSRIKNDLRKALVEAKIGPTSTEQDRILFIGCTSKPFDPDVDQKTLIDSFDEHIWVSFPEYGSRVVLWQKFMENHGVQIDPTKLNISTLARVSDGYSAGSIRQTVDRVLTARRVQQLKNRPLKEMEFIGPLSRTAYSWNEERDHFQRFDFVATGEEKIQEARRKAEAAAEADGPGKKGKR